jgi:hypothetical protein
MIDKDRIIENLESTISDIGVNKRSLSTEGFELLRSFLTFNISDLESKELEVNSLRDQILSSMSSLIQSPNQSSESEELITVGIFCKILRHILNTSYFFKNLVKFG